MKKKLYFLAIFFLYYSFNLKAQAYEGDYNVSNQSDIDAFCGNYTSITGTLYIDGRNNNITNFSGLSCLTSVGGFILIADFNNNNISLLEFTKLQTVGGYIDIIRNEKIDAICFPQLTSVTSPINVGINPGLKNFSIPKLQTIDTGIEIFYNTNLKAIDFSSIQSIGGTQGGTFTITDNPVLNAINIPNLEIAGGDFDVKRNASLPIIEAVGLTSVGGSLRIENNNSLTCLDFRNLSQIGTQFGGQLRVSSNPNLSTCGSLYSYVNGSFDVGNEPELSGNAEGCNQVAGVGEIEQGGICIPVDFLVTHYYNSPDGLNGLLLNTINSTNLPDNAIRPKVAADGTQSSRFVLSDPTLKLEVEDGGILGSKIVGLLEIGEQPGEYFYTHPAYSENSNQNDIVEFIVTDEAGTELNRIKIEIFRAPVLAINNQLSWLLDNGLAPFIRTRPRYIRYQVSSISGEDFTDFNEISTSIKKLLIHQLSEKVAGAKVDIVGYGTGGIAARNYLQSPKYSDDINKLITINTPHSGMLLANYLSDFWARKGDLCSYIDEYSFTCSDQNLLKVDGRLINFLNGPNLNKAKVPSHAIVSHGKLQIPAPPIIIVVRNEKELLKLILNQSIDAILATIPPLAYTKMAADWGIFIHEDFVFKIVNSLFGTELNDSEISLLSQSGGLIGNQRSVFSNTLHDEMIYNYGIEDGRIVFENDDVINRVEELLGAPPFGDLYFSQTGFNPVKLNYSPLPLNLNSTFNSPSVIIDSILKKNVYLPGDTLDIRVTKKNASHLIGSIASSTSLYQAKSFADTQIFSFVVDTSLIGPRTFIATAYDTTNIQFAIDTFSFFVDTDLIPDSIIIIENNSSLFVGENKALEILGYFNGIAMNISQSPSISFIVSDDNIITNSGNNLLGVNAGSTIIRVEYRDKITSTQIEVLGEVGCFIDANKDLSMDTLFSNIYQAGAILESANTIPNNENVIFEAKQSITLNTGFHAVEGSDFLARINDCQENSIENIVPEELNIPSARLTNKSTIQDVASLTNKAEQMNLKISPNPFSLTSNIQISIPTNSYIQLNLFNINGHQIKQMTNEFKEKGNYDLTLDASNLAAGFYYLSLKSATETITKKIVVGQF